MAEKELKEQFENLARKMGYALVPIEEVPPEPVTEISREELLLATVYIATRPYMVRHEDVVLFVWPDLASAANAIIKNSEAKAKAAQKAANNGQKRRKRTSRPTAIKMASAGRWETLKKQLPHVPGIIPRHTPGGTSRWLGNIKGLETDKTAWENDLQAIHARLHPIQKMCSEDTWFSTGHICELTDIGITSGCLKSLIDKEGLVGKMFLEKKVKRSPELHDLRYFRLIPEFTPE